MIIYKTTNLINGKIYVGQDLHNNPKYFGSGLILKNSIKKYGKENFVKETLEYCNNKNELNEKEIYWIEKLNSRNRNIGYNISSGGVYGDTLTNNPNKIEIIKKISKSNKGKKRSDDTKLKLSLSLKGHKLDEKTKLKISKTRKIKGYKPSKKNIDITIKRLKENYKNEKNINAKTFYLISPDNINYTTCGNLPTFCKEHNLNLNVIRNWVNKGKIPSTSRYKLNKIRENTNGWEIKTDINICIENRKSYYILISPQGKEYKLYYGLMKFCKQNNIWYETLSDNINKGKIKEPVKLFTQERINTTGWEIKKIII